jgi:putative nucleotidyltransferase with HDIG domain/PAS domain S-box-containing protein
MTEPDIHFRVLVENLQEGVALIAITHQTTLFCNRAIREIFEIEESVQSPDITALMPEEFRQSLIHHFKSEQSPSLIEEHQVTTMAGKVRWLEMVSTIIDMDGSSAIMLLAKDISEKKEAAFTLHRRASEFAALYAMSQRLATQHDLSAMRGEVVEHAVALLSVTCGEIMVFDPEHNNLEVSVISGFSIPIGSRQSIDEGVVGLVAKTLQPMIIDVYAQGNEKPLVYKDVPVGPIIAVPMLFQGELIGVLSLFELEPTSRRFTGADVRLLGLFASQAAASVHNTRLLTIANRHLEEMQAINRITAVVRTLQSTEEILSGLLDEILGVMGTDAGCIWLDNPFQDKKNTLITRGWFSKLLLLNPETQGLINQVISTDKSIILEDFSLDENIPDAMRKMIPQGWGGICLPIRSSDTITGVMMMAFLKSHILTDHEIHLLETVCDISGGAVQRSLLFERTEQQLKRISALYAIDSAIGSSFDLNLILRILLDQVTTQLHVDAADILLYHPETETLEYAAGLRFHSSNLEQLHLKLDRDYAGKAILESRVISIADLTKTSDNFIRTKFLLLEGFVSYCGVPLISKGEEIGVLEIFNRKPLDPASEWLEFLEALAAQAAIALNNARLIEGLQKTNRELTHAYDSTIEGWVQALDLRDQETEGHSLRVADMSVRLARMAGISDKLLVHVRRGALLHDIGKMAIPDNILNKPGALTPLEWDIMRLHPIYAYNMLSSISFLEQAIDIPFLHHEKWDGSGYPRNLKGEDIPLAVRVFSVIDVWDALTSNRPYRSAWPKEKALNHIQEQSAIHFDPRVTKLFLKLLEATN